MAKTTSPKEAMVINIPKPDRKSLIIRLIGDTDLVCHAWSEKARREMADKQQGKAKGKKAPKDPKEELAGCFYRHPKDAERYGFPAVAFKSAMISAVRLVEGMTMTLARQLVFVAAAEEGWDDLVPLEYSEIIPREDPVRLGGMTADLRYRPAFRGWSTVLRIDYFANIVTPEQLVNLLVYAGMAVGVGEWRPEKGGTWGTFHPEGTEAK